MIRSNACQQCGFTLLELLIAITIMAAISVLTAESIRSSIQNKNRIQEQMNVLSMVRDTLKIMESDIRKAFHHQDFNKEMIEAINKERAKNQNKTTPIPSNDGTPPNPTTTSTSKSLKVPEYLELTQFIGDKNSLHFTNLNHVRSSRDALESGQQEVGYYVADCRARNKSTKSKCLWRRTHPYIDDDITKEGDAIVLMENVEEFKLRYFGPQRDDWIDEWKSDKSGDATSKGQFPFAVEVTLTYYDRSIKNGKKLSMTMIAAIDFPNNEEKKSETDSEGSNLNSNKKSNFDEDDDDDDNDLH